jgi:hypothetical protein
MALVCLSMALVCLSTLIVAFAVIGVLFIVYIITIFMESEMVFKFQLSNLLIHCEKYFSKENKMVWDWGKTCLLAVDVVVEEKPTIPCTQSTNNDKKSIEYQKLVNQFVESLQNTKGETIEIKITNVSTAIPIQHGNINWLVFACSLLVFTCLAEGYVRFAIAFTLWMTCFIAFYVCITRASLFHLEFRFQHYTTKLQPFTAGYSNKGGFVWDRNPLPLRAYITTEDEKETKDDTKVEEKETSEKDKDVKLHEESDEEYELVIAKLRNEMLSGTCRLERIANIKRYFAYLKNDNVETK